MGIANYSYKAGLGNYTHKTLSIQLYGLHAIGTIGR